MIENLTNKQKKIIIIIGIIAVIGVIYFVYSKVGNSNIEENSEDEIMVQNENKSNTSQSTEEEDDYIVVHITGAIKNPGTVRLKENSRIEDAIEKSGGLTEDADISNVNLAYVLDDGMKITIPATLNVEGDEQEVISSESGENIIDSENDTSSNSMININKATQTELEGLPGIGASLADRIISYREENGKFGSIDEIKNVSGIGDSKFENIKDLICAK